MGFFSYIRNVVTGRFAHWNDTNNRVVEGLWKQIEPLNPQQKIVYRQIFISSTLIVDYLLAPHKDERILEIDSREVDFEQFKELYTLLISSMARTYEALNPSLSSIVRDGYRNVTNTTLQGGPMPLFRDENGEPDLQRVTAELWKGVVRITGANKGTTTLEAYPFTSLYLSAATDAFKDINENLSETI